jgi:fructosamine-3-kinase
MISKLIYHLDNNHNVQSNKKLVEETLKRHFYHPKRSVIIEPIGGGTLGITFVLIVDGKRRFVKTHLPSQSCRMNVIKEIKLMTFLYEELNVQRLDLCIGSSIQTYFLMDELTYPEQVPHITDVQNLIVSYSRQLNNFEDLNNFPSHYTFSNLFTLGQKALEELLDKQLISLDVYDAVLPYFDYLQILIPALRPVLCHGDLSNKNIMYKNDKLIVVDWEDAFWGVEDYDYLYWLTFFNNRKYYSQNIFKGSYYDKRKQISILLLILILKSYSIFRNS